MRGGISWVSQCQALERSVCAEISNRGGRRVELLRRSRGVGGGRVDVRCLVPHCRSRGQMPGPGAALQPEVRAPVPRSWLAMRTGAREVPPGHHRGVTHPVLTVAAAARRRRSPQPTCSEAAFLARRTALSRLGELCGSGVLSGRPRHKVGSWYIVAREPLSGSPHWNGTGAEAKRW